MSWKFVVSLVIALIVAVFAILNSEAVVINFLFKKASISQALIILISALVGALVVALLGSVNRFKLMGKLKDEKKLVEELEEEVGRLKVQVSGSMPSVPNVPEATVEPVKPTEVNHEEIL